MRLGLEREQEQLREKSLSRQVELELQGWRAFKPAAGPQVDGAPAELDLAEPQAVARHLPSPPAELGLRGVGCGLLGLGWPPRC